MKALSGFGRNDVIRAIALVSVVAFPFIADAQRGSVKSVNIAQDAQPATALTVKNAVASRVSCSEEHWPFLSTECLRRSAEVTEVTEPRVVSMNAAFPPDSVTQAAAVKRVAFTNSVQIRVPSAKPKKPQLPKNRNVPG